jgi:F-type H+-transporting ATPase subunit b
MEGFSKIGVDWWGVLLYLINYGILLFVLAKLVYPRVLKVIDERRSLIANNIHDADRLRQEMMAQATLAEKERIELLSKLEQESVSVKKELQQKRKEMLEQLSLEREKMLVEARALIAAEKEALFAEVQAKIMQVVQMAVLHITMTKVSEKDIASSISQTWKEVEKR